MNTIFKHLVFVIIIAVGGVFCFSGLATRTLWQDEGETAVLAQSILHNGVPKALNGPNLILQNRIGYDKSYRWTFHPWAQFYLVAASLKLSGQTTFAARAPFALCGLVTIAVLYICVYINFQSVPAAALSALLLITSATFMIHLRQCRYYALGALTCLLVVVFFIELIKHPTWRWGLAWTLALTAQFYTDFGTLIAITPGLIIAMFINRLRKKQLITIVLSVAITLLLITPGFILHYDRITSSQGHNQHFLQVLLVHLGYLDGWFIPVLVLAAAGVIALFCRLRAKKPITQQTKTAITVALVIASAFIVMAYAVPYPHIRYVVSQMPLAKLLLGVILIKGYDLMRDRAIPFLYTIPVLTAVVMIVIFTNITAFPLHYILAKSITPDSLYYSESNSFVRKDFFGLLHELRGDFVCPNRVTLNVVKDLTEPDGSVAVNYGDLPLMFYRPGMKIMGGGGNVNLSKDPKTFPDVIIERSFPNRKFKSYLRYILTQRDYLLIEIPVPEMTWGNIPEPREHRYRTPQKQCSFKIYLRSDHKQRLAKLPQTIEEITARWHRRL